MKVNGEQCSFNSNENKTAILCKGSETRTIGAALLYGRCLLALDIGHVGHDAPPQEDRDGMTCIDIITMQLAFSNGINARTVTGCGQATKPAPGQTSEWKTRLDQYQTLIFRDVIVLIRLNLFAAMASSFFYRRIVPVHF